MRRTITLLSVLLLALGMTGVAAMADEPDTPLWEGDDVLDSDSHTTIVTAPEPTEPPEVDPQQASVTLSGPLGLETEEFGDYVVEVTNTSDTRELDEWVLGLSVTNITDVEDLIIRYDDGSTDITKGTPGVEVEIDDGVIYLRGSDDPTIGIGEAEVFHFEVAFRDEGAFTGTAYVVSTDPGGVTDGLEADSHQFYPYYDEDAGSDQSLDPVFTEHPATGDGDYAVCTLDRTRYREAGVGTPGSSAGALVSDNRIKCYDANGDKQFEQYLIMVSEDHDLAESLADNATGFGGTWILYSLWVDGVGDFDVTTNDVTPYTGFSTS